MKKAIIALALVIGLLAVGGTVVNGTSNAGVNTNSSTPPAVFL